MVFVVLEGFSGTGKTTLARRLERRGWVRFEESAHAVRRRRVPVAERADTYADFSLMSATLLNAFEISQLRDRRRLVSEGFLLSDLAYARIRYDLGKSRAFPAMLAMAKEVMTHSRLQPDLYVRLEAKSETIDARQMKKNRREQNVSDYFRTRYYSAISEIHEEMGERRVETIYTDSDPAATLKEVLWLLRKRGLEG
ncbi:MAG: AAA family ATPase [Nitrososphaerota archaeon]|nr:AAA family ATPase [Nitrososphaerota archaeon]